MPIRGRIAPLPRAQYMTASEWRTRVRILVVEDEPKLAASLHEGLREARYTVDVASEGREALDFVSTSTYDAMILDIQLPGVDGFSVCRTIRSRGDATPILMLTARDAVADKIAGLDHGADDYLTKPFVLDEMLARLRALLRRNSSQKDGLLRVADVALDPAARLVRRGDRQIDPHLPRVLPAGGADASARLDRHARCHHRTRVGIRVPGLLEPP